MNNHILLLSYQESRISILNQIGIDTEEQLSLEKEFTKYFQSNEEHIGREGLVYSKTMDCYYYAMVLPSEPNTYIFSSHEINSSISLYYNLHEIKEKYRKHFSSITLEKLISGDASQNPLQMWLTEFSNLAPEIVPNPFAVGYNDILVGYLQHNFESKMAELFYCLTMQIPIIIQTKRENQISIAGFFAELLETFHISTDIQFKNEFSHIILTEKADLSKYDQFLFLDSMSGKIQTRLDNPQLQGLNDVVSQGIEFHSEKIMPFPAVIYAEVFWNIQKVYGVLAIHNGKLNFADYLHQEKMHFVGLLTMLFEKLAFLNDMIV